MAHKNNVSEGIPNTKVEAVKKDLNRLSETGHKSKKVYHESLKVQNQSTNKHTIEDEKSLNEIITLNSDFVCAKMQVDFNMANFSSSFNLKLHQKANVKNAAPIIEIIDNLANQISIHSCFGENSNELKISFNQLTLPATILTLRQTSTGWKLNFNTSSAFSHRQIDQHLDYLKQRFEQRRLGTITTHLNLYSPS